MWAISMKYRKMILIIIIISLGIVLLSYIANTSRTHILVHTLTPSPFWLWHVDDEVNAPFSPALNDRSSCFIQINSSVCDAVFAIVLCFLRIKKCLGRTETRTRDRMCCQSIRTHLRHLPGRSSKNCDLQFANTDRQT